MANINTPKILIGLGLIILGFAYSLNKLIPSLDLDTIITYAWPFLFMLAGIVILLNHHHRPICGVVLLILGAVIFIQNAFSFNVMTLWPLIIIFAGLSMLFRASYFSDLSISKDVSTDNELQNAVVFGSMERRYSSNNFKGGNLKTIFGSALIDLSKVTIPKEGAKLNMLTILGNIEIKVPKNVRIECFGSGLIGSLSNKAITNGTTEGGILSITGTTILGGVEIIN